MAWCLASVLLLAGAAGASPPSAALLPQTTRQYLSIPDVRRFEAGWARTQLARLLADPQVKPFADDLRRQWSDPLGLGVGWDDVRAAAGGELSWAVVQPAPGQAASVQTLDATGKRDAVNALVRKIRLGLERQGYQLVRRPGDAGGPTVYARRGRDGTTRRVAISLEGELLLVSDNEEILTGIRGRLAGGAGDSLAQRPAYHEVRRRSRDATAEPDLFWFAEPVALAEARRAAGAAPPPGRRDTVKVLRDEGFDAVQGVGGGLRFAAGGYEMLLHTAVYAPPPYRKSMRMFRLLAGDDFAPPPWVPGRLGAYVTGYADVGHGFDTLGSLLDGLWGEPGDFERTVEKLRTGPDGPMVDVRKEVIGRLAPRGTLVLDAESPEHFHGDRTLLAFATHDEKGLARQVERLMAGDDPDVIRHEGRYVWEIRPQPKKPPARKDGVPRRRQAPHSGIAVAHGHLLIASHFALLEEALASPAGPLARRPDFERVSKELALLGAGKDSLRLFLRTDETFRTAYEFLRHNQLAEAPSLQAQLLHLLLEGGGSRRVDGRKLPAFADVRRFLGPCGIFVTSQKDGWTAVGVVLKK
jgi:hypothetical protein